MTRSALFLALTTAAALASARPPIVTFSKADAAQAFGQGCGVGAKGKIRAHRNANGTMLSLVGEKQAEAVLYAQSQSCNQLQDDVVDIWRRDDGSVAAMVIDRGDGHRLLIGEHAELRGKRFDVERTGQYLIISHGTSSTLSAVSKPYIKMADLNLDAQRLFPRKGALLVVGDNAATGKLEGRIIRVTPTGLQEDPTPVSIGEMPAGVRILDYAEDSDDLLLAGVDAAGQPSFVAVNLATSRASAVTPLKLGDDMGLFLQDEALRTRLTGSPAAAKAAGGGAPKSGPGKGEKKGWFKF